MGARYYRVICSLEPFNLAQDTDKKMIDESADATGSSKYDPLKNKHLKGRRRFNADLADIGEACSAGLVLKGLRVKRQSSEFSKGVAHSQ